ncbi:DMT family transporter [Kiloniella laminariae]|uniref:DMT family transporter n=1 Tax=Kiloniella laminariae TaxID=454162 RepID=UPI00035D7E65|nr:EamA family transporter [Kiloniella laminariae]
MERTARISSQDRFDPLLEFVLLGLLALLWGGSYLLIQISLETIPPLTLIALRVSIAAVLLGVVMKGRGEALPKDKTTWGMLFVQALFNSIGAWTVLAWGQQYVESGLASVLNSTSPVFVFFFMLFFVRGETPPLFKLLGACLGIIGVLLIVGPEVLQGLGRDALAQLAVLLGAVLYAGAAVYGKRLSHLSPTVAATGTMIWAVFCLVPASLLFEKPWQVEMSERSILAALALAIFSTGLALLIYFRLLRTLGSLGVASQSYLRAGVGVALGTFVLGEQFDLFVATGVLIALSGVVLINIKNKKKVFIK